MGEIRHLFERAVRLQQGNVVLGDSKALVTLQQGDVELVGFLRRHFRVPQAQIGMDILHLVQQHRVAALYVVRHAAVDVQGCPPDFHKIDAVVGTGRNPQVLSANGFAGVAVFKPLFRGDDKDQYPAHPQAQRKQKGREGFARAGHPEHRKRTVTVLIRVVVVHNDRRIVVKVDSQQHPRVIAEFIGGERKGGGRAAGEDVPPGLFGKVSV